MVVTEIFINDWESSWIGSVLLRYDRVQRFQVPFFF